MADINVVASADPPQPLPIIAYIAARIAIIEGSSRSTCRGGLQSALDVTNDHNNVINVDNM